MHSGLKMLWLFICTLVTYSVAGQLKRVQVLNWPFYNCVACLTLDCADIFVLPREDFVHHRQWPMSTILVLALHNQDVPDLWLDFAVLSIMLWRSLNDVKYSFCKRLQRLSLHALRYLARLRKSTSLNLHASFSGR